jgi:hypothetical protein
VKGTAAGIVGFILAVLTALHLPTRPRLELYDVNDLTYSFTDFPTVDISLASRPAIVPILDLDLLLTGQELASRLQPLVPGADVPVQFQNGLLIVRGTAMQHLAVRGALFAHRARNGALTSSIDGISTAKATLSSRLFGMITR